MADLKYILEALRQKPLEPGVYRSPGLPVKRQRGSLMDTLTSAHQDINYQKYVRQQHEIGETPVSYAEWVK